jgi:hypothetical protein
MLGCRAGENTCNKIIIIILIINLFSAAYKDKKGNNVVAALDICAFV